MKSKITKKRVFETHKNVIKVGYCNLYYLLKFRQPSFYTTRVEGWGADIYSIGNAAIVTGYAPFGNIVPSYDFVKTFDDKAREIQSESISYEDKRSRTTSLLEDFLNQVTKHRA
jgi:hypothetical protein